MVSKYWLLAVVFVAVATSYVPVEGQTMDGSEASAHCRPSDKKCVFNLIIKQSTTMMHKGDKLFAEDGKLYRYDVTNTSNAIPINDSDVVVGDGWEQTRLVTLANEQFPGPAIIVYRTQDVEINVQNDLHGQDVTIHWHGIDMHGTPWMDGVPYINHCPIASGQSFRYSFNVNENGTYWWHSHIGTQRSNGLAGPFIVKEKTEPYENEHIMMVQDWNHDGDSDFATQTIGASYDGRVKWNAFQTIDGGLWGSFRIHSVLIDGRGRYKDESTDVTIDTPLKVYRVVRGETYRFRVITTATYYPLRISVDQHKLQVTASDGFDLEPLTTESFVIFPGERYDFNITCDQEVANYWIRAVPFVKDIDRTPVGEAILRYDGAGNSYPTTSRDCISVDGCSVANCPFNYKSFRIYGDTTCISQDKFMSAPGTKSAPQYDKGNFRQYFLNFGFVQGRASVNGRQFVSPTVNIYTQPKQFSAPCEDNPDCDEDGKACSCMHVLKFPGDATIQIVLTNLVQSSNRKFGSNHPAHIHGHDFYVVKVGYPSYNEITGEIDQPTADIVCENKTGSSDLTCKNPRWKDQSWDIELPEANINRAFFKDTVAIPSGGYVVIRFKADNPGVWNAHCHMEPHNNGGMRFILNESFPEQPKAPADLPICNNFPPTDYSGKAETNDSTKLGACK
ncbi:LAC1-like protein [Mya arenaria]|uniref:LAC1-like protein n=1 Tax=Mya arenaria TaxID=6604 RepID=A0ABY7E8J1_MYAAR|nr:LAC1-like protein [Mya arenaria]